METWRQNLDVFLQRWWQIPELVGMLTSEPTRRKYLQPTFPDQTFAAGLASAIAQTQPRCMLDAFHALCQKVLEQMGGFEIDGWSLRTPAT